MGYSIWENGTTKHGFPIDLMVSSLQKSIRRGGETDEVVDDEGHTGQWFLENAVRVAYELYTSSPVLLEKLWSRLVSISVEDCGCRPEAAVYVHTLNQMRKDYGYDDVDQPMFFVQAIRILCGGEKDRSTDFLKNIVIKSAEMGQLPEIPDLAYDKHTKRGQELGRDSFHFFNEACRVIPQKDVENRYRERYGELLDEYYHGDTPHDPDAFVYAIGRV